LLRKITAAPNSPDVNCRHSTHQWNMLYFSFLKGTSCSMLRLAIITDYRYLTLYFPTLNIHSLKPWFSNTTWISNFQSPFLKAQTQAISTFSGSPSKIRRSSIIHKLTIPHFPSPDLLDYEANLLIIATVKQERGWPVIT
jgi:hypothetical protein